MAEDPITGREISALLARVLDELERVTGSVDQVSLLLEEPCWQPVRMRRSASENSTVCHNGPHSPRA